MFNTLLYRLFLVTVFLLTQNTIATADQTASTSQRAAAIISQWEQWTDKHQITEASIAVSYNGQQIAQQGKNRNANTPAPVASLTKSITGVCIAQLVAGGRLSFDTKIQSVVPELKTDVAIRSLLTHTSGFQSDITQRPDNYPSLDQEHLLWVSQQELNTGQTATEGSGFAYNNSNYAMLGAAISALTNNSYERACNDLVFKPIGITDATLNPDWRIMSSWGGWKLSAVSYLKFIDTYYTDSKVLNQAPDQFPNYIFDGGVGYGMGVFYRPGRTGGFNYWHDGKWHTDRDGIKHRFATYFAKWDNGWAVSTNHNISAINGEHAELDQVLAGAAHQP